jgi:hypothetical protein
MYHKMQYNFVMNMLIFKYLPANQVKDLSDTNRVVCSS